ncbi:thioesterase family protein [Salipaludibacillus sp. CF4.18]|uniref:thioesterase family protein n=1 Tax=Salipaludibacillus sp. CF4.18 TaxID=3373081 RepID=UPI003EE453A9
MEQSPVRYSCKVLEDWVDYNGHMNDAAYAKVFSLATDSWINEIGLHAEARQKYAYTIFTLESHLCYLKEAHEGEALQVFMQLLDDDEKRLHIFFHMQNEKGDLLATNEQMLMGMDTAQHKPASFPSGVTDHISRLRQEQKHLEIPKQAGRRIGIKQ